MTPEQILKQLNIEDEVLAIFPYGSRIYGTARPTSDFDYIIVLKRAMLESGAFRQNAISNTTRSVQGVLYSRGGFIDAINNYEIGALECLSLPEEKIILKKWPFKVAKWHEKTMVKKIIEKASASRHIANMQAKSGFPERAKKGMFHALRILHFGLQLKEHQKIVDFTVCNSLYHKFQKIEPEEFDTRNYYREFDQLLDQLRT